MTRVTTDREGTIELWQQDDERWRWRWRVHHGDTVLISHRAFDSRAEAVESAREAYPDAPVPEPEDTAPRRTARRRLAGMATATAALAAVAVVVRRRAGRRAATRPRSGSLDRPGWGRPRG